MQIDFVVDFWFSGASDRPAQSRLTANTSGSTLARLAPEVCRQSGAKVFTEPGGGKGSFRTCIDRGLYMGDHSVVSVQNRF